MLEVCDGFTWALLCGAGFSLACIAAGMVCGSVFAHVFAHVILRVRRKKRRSRGR